MSRSCTDLGAYTHIDQQNLPSDLSHNKDPSLVKFSSQQACQGMSNDDTTAQRKNVMEIKQTKTERRHRTRDNENSENIQNENTNVPSEKRAIPKEKNMLLDMRQSVKKSLGIRSNGILTERNPNIGFDSNRSQKDSEHQNIKSQTNTPLATNKDPLTAAMNLKKLQKYTVKQLLHISKSKINFGNNMPGQIKEESLDIVNKTNQDLVVQIVLDSENQEFKTTEEYVYSIRRNHLYDFNDKHYLIMAPFSSASFKVTLKVPDVKKECDNSGYADISIQGLKTSFKVVLESKIKIPRVVCPKSLYHQNAKLNIIKLAAKEGKKHEYKLPFKNEGDTPVTMEFFFHNPGEAYKGAKIDCSVYPQTQTIQPNSSIFLNFSAKVSRTGAGKEKKHKEKERLCAKKVLLGKVRDTNLIYSFYFCIETY